MMENKLGGDNSDPVSSPAIQPNGEIMIMTRSEKFIVLFLALNLILVHGTFKLVTVTRTCLGSSIIRVILLSKSATAVPVNMNSVIMVKLSNASGRRQPAEPTSSKAVSESYRTV